MVYRPWTNRLMGVEMEMRSYTRGRRRDVTAGMLADAVTLGIHGFRDQSINRVVGQYFHSNGTTWDVKTDSTCGYEVATPAFYLNDQGHFDPLKRVCEELNQVGPSVDRSCGLHVHVSLEDYSNWRDLQRLLNLWIRYEPFFMEIVPSARRTNQYCYPIRHGAEWSAGVPSRLLDALRTNSEDSFYRVARNSEYFEKYKSLNITHWWRSQRVEFRLHSGTLNYNKIRAWCMLVTSIAQRVVEPSMPEIEPYTHVTQTRPLGTSYVLRQLGLLPSSIRSDVPQESLELSAWVNARRQQFGHPPAPTPAPAPAPAPAPVTMRFNSSRNPGCAADTRLPCPRPRVTGYALCRGHLNDYDERRGWSEVVEFVPEINRYPNSARQFNHAVRIGEGCEAGIGRRCLEPRVEQYRFCQTHLDDFWNGLNYRIIQPSGATV